MSNPTHWIMILVIGTFHVKFRLASEQIKVGLASLFKLLCLSYLHRNLPVIECTRKWTPLIVYVGLTKTGLWYCAICLSIAFSTVENSVKCSDSLTTFCLFWELHNDSSWSVYNNLLSGLAGNVWRSVNPPPGFTQFVNSLLSRGVC